VTIANVFRVSILKTLVRRSCSAILATERIVPLDAVRQNCDFITFVR
jgi:hypothetical protein